MHMTEPGTVQNNFVSPRKQGSINIGTDQKQTTQLLHINKMVVQKQSSIFVSIFFEQCGQ